jgi:serine beta-lactamase-like protein LACTB, mitochondrial
MRIVLFLSFSALISWSQPAPEIPSGIIRRLERALESERVAQKIVGMSVAVGHRGALRYSGGFGLSDLENGYPARPDTIYRLGSISKTITAVAALQLYDRGRLDLDSPVQRYVPAFPRKPWTITLREVLGHFAGIRHYKGDEMMSTRYYANIADGLKFFSGDALEHEPGTKYLYTTHGFTLVGAAVENAAGQRFVDYVSSRVFALSGMDTAREDSVYAIIRNRARGYSQGSNGEIINSGLADTSYKVPGGGFVGSAVDVARFGMALDGGLLLKRDTYRLMTTSQKTTDGKETGYGMGISLTLFEGKKAYSHSGSQQATRTVFAIFPEEQFVVAILTNSEHADYKKLMDAAVKVLIPGP